MITSATVKGRCPICGVGSCRCGPDTSHITPIDVPSQEAAMAGSLKVYDVVYNGQQTRMKLTDEQAVAMGVKKRPTAQNKKRTAQDKARPVDTTPSKADDSPHVCDACGFEAKTAAGLGSHARSHEDD